MSRGVAAATAEASVMCEEKCFNEFDEGRTNGARGKKEEEDDFYLAVLPPNQTKCGVKI